MVAPGDGGIEIGDEVLGKASGEGFAIELGREAGGEVLKHDEAGEDGVAGCPGSGLVAEEAELEGEMSALEVDGCVDSGGVSLEEMELAGWEGGDGAVCGGAELEGSLETVVGEETGAEDFGECAGGVAAEGVHLPEAILCSDEALGEEEVVDRGGAEVWDAVVVALDGDGSGEAGEGESSVELGEGVVHGLAEPVAGGDETDDGDEEDQREESDEDAAEDSSAQGLERGFLLGEGLVGNYVGVGEVGQAHVLMASVNGVDGMWSLRRAMGRVAI